MEHSWQLYAHWDLAYFHARVAANLTGIRRRVRQSLDYPGFWVVEEATA